MALLDIQTNIQTDLTRLDLPLSLLASAVNDAIAHYEHDRFFFNTTRSLTFSTTPTQQAYTSSDLAQIPDILKIDHLFLPMLNNVGAPMTIYELDYYEPDQFEWLAGSSPGSGKPTVYTYVDYQILLWPTPTQIYTLRPHMHYRLSPRPLVNPTDSNDWVVRAEQLIRAHAKLLLYTNVLEDADGAQRMQAETQAFKMKLDQETSSRSSSGRIRGTEF